MKLSNKLFISFSILTILIIILSFVSIKATTKLNQLQNVIVLSEAMINNISEIRISTIESVAESKPQQLDKAKQFLEQAHNQINYLESISNTPKLLSLVNTAKMEIQKIEPILDIMSKTFNNVMNADATITKIGADILEKVHVIQDIAAQTQNTELLNTVAKVKSLFIVARLHIANYINMKTPEAFQVAKNAVNNSLDYIKLVDDTNPELSQIIKNINLYFQEATPLINGIETLQNSITDSANVAKLLSKSSSQISEQARINFIAEKNSITQQIIFVSAFAIIISIFLAIFISKNVMKQLGADPSELANIANEVSKGTFTLDNSKVYTGVYKNITDMVVEQMSQAHEIRNTHEHMQKIAQQLEQVSQVASAASMELSVQIEHSENGAQLQADQVATTATALEEMNSTVLEIAKNAGVTSEGATSVRAEAISGSKSMQDCVSAMEDVRNESLKLQSEMDVLSNHAQAINEIMNVISDIADQTNLLALNAAIEAARAGDAGRGFAVVADEVRNLAEKTMTSTADVGNAIFAIQKSTTDNIHLVTETVQKIEKVTELLSNTDNTLQEIVNLADTTADQIHAIATASEEQSATSEEITQSVESINKIAKANSNNMQEARLAVNEVVNQTKVLSELILQLQQTNKK